MNRHVFAGLAGTALLWEMLVPQANALPPMIPVGIYDLRGLPCLTARGRAAQLIRPQHQTRRRVGLAANTNLRKMRGSKRLIGADASTRISALLCSSRMSRLRVRQAVNCSETGSCTGTPPS